MDGDMYIERTLERYVEKAAQQFPVLLVVGPRQVGKTTFLRNQSQDNRTYVTLDDPTLAGLAKEEPKLFLERFPPPLLIDEIQYAPELLPHIKMAVDQNRNPGQFWLTGSQQFHLMKGVSESLAGRVGIVNLLGLSQFERTGHAAAHEPFLPTNQIINERGHQLLGTSLKGERPHPPNLPSIFEQIWRGSFPAISLNEEMDRDLFYSSYVQTYLQRDVRDLTRVGSELSFLKFLRAAAARTGQLLNLADMARDCDISQPTAKTWLSILQTSGIVYLLEPYATNLSKRLIKAPKLYFLDTGLCCYLTGWSDPTTLEAGAMSGALLETFVVSEVIKSWWHNGKQAPLFFYRDKDKKEIDLLIVTNQTAYPIEIKKTGVPSKKAIQAFSALEHIKMDVGEGGLVCFVNLVTPIDEKNNAIPVSYM